MSFDRRSVSETATDLRIEDVPSSTCYLNRLYTDGRNHVRQFDDAYLSFASAHDIVDL